MVRAVTGLQPRWTCQRMPGWWPSDRYTYRDCLSPTGSSCWNGRGRGHPERASEERGVTRIVAIANQKGGVGKTTTAVNLAASLALSGSRVLLVDLDPQGNATMGSGIDKRTLGKSTFDVLMDLHRLQDCLVPANEMGFDVLPSNADLTGAEVTLLDELAREVRLRNALNPVQENYDYIFIDCPSNTSLVTINALASADYVILPVKLEVMSTDGINHMVDFISMVKEEANPDLRILGILITQYEKDTKVSAKILEEIKQNGWEGDLFKTRIRKNVTIAEGQAYRKNIFDYNRKSTGAQDYVALGDEVLRKIKLK